MHTPQAQKSFEELKDKLTYASVLSVLCFAKEFEVECDAFEVGIGVILIQEGKPLASFSENLSDSRRKYSTNDKEFFAIIQALEHWTHYKKLHSGTLRFDVMIFRATSLGKYF